MEEIEAGETAVEEAESVTLEPETVAPFAGAVSAIEGLDACV